MASIKFSTKERRDYTVVEFSLEGGVISPEDLGNIKPPEVDQKKGVVIVGRGPIWLYCFLVHHYHPSKFIATYDPRLGGIIVETHDKNYKVGDIIEVEM